MSKLIKIFIINFNYIRRQFIILLLWFLTNCYNFILDIRISLRSNTWITNEIKKIDEGKLLVTGYFDEVLGIGRSATLTLNAIKLANIDVKFSDLRSATKRLITGKEIPLPAKDISRWLIHANAPEAEIALYIYKHSDWEKCYRIAYWAWESNLLPDSWARVARHFHEIWVPSDFVRQAMVRRFNLNGQQHLNDNIKVVPHPVKVGRPVEFSRASLGICEDAFMALLIFDGRSGYARKNPTGAIDAWCKAFPEPSLKAHLIVKCHHADADFNGYDTLLKALSGRPDLILINLEIDAEQLAGLQQASDLLISLHRAEGFGLNLFEAMLLGTPVLATGWSGNLSFMSEFPECLIPFSLTPSKELGGEWAEPDVEAAAIIIGRFFGDVQWRRMLGVDMQKYAEVKSNEWLENMVKHVSPE